MSLQYPERAKRALEDAIRMRETMYAVFWALVTKKPVPAAALLSLNHDVQEAAQHAMLVREQGTL